MAEGSAFVTMKDKGFHPPENPPAFFRMAA